MVEMTDAQNTAREALELGEKLYDAYWTRNATNAEKVPFTQQADAIRVMWTNIAADAQAALASSESPPAQTSDEGVRTALEDAREFTVCFLAFMGRDRGTERLDRSLDGLEKIAREVDAKALAALSRGEAVGCVMADEPGKCVNPACREDGACARSHHPSAGAPSLEAIGLIADLIVRDVCELPDRTSPDDWPEAMLVTGEELHELIVERFAEASPPALKASDLEREMVARVRSVLETAKALPVGARSSYDALIDEALEQLALIPLSTISEGWRPVPREPTREMWTAGGDAQMALRAKQNHHHDSISEAVWQAMWDASPAISEGGEA